MWVSEEKGSGEMSYTWQAPGHGEWALLLSSDGTAPAPTDISVTVDNQAGTPWAIPLMVIGSALLALAALLFLMAPRKPKKPWLWPGAVRPSARPIPQQEPSRWRRFWRPVRAPSRNLGSRPRRPLPIFVPAAAKDNPADDAAAAAAAKAPSTMPPPPCRFPCEANPRARKTVDSETARTTGLSADADKGSRFRHDAQLRRGSVRIVQGRSKSGKPSVGVPSHARRPPPTRTAEQEGQQTSSAPLPLRVRSGYEEQGRWGAALLAVLLAGGVSPAVAADTATPAPSAEASAAASATAAAGSKPPGSRTCWIARCSASPIRWPR